MQPGDVVADRFEVERLAGTGGMGEVYRARDRLSGAPVALKVLRTPEGPHLPRLFREAEVLAELAHPAIVRYVAHGSLAGAGAFLAMEWLEGETLGQRITREPLRVDETLLLGRRVAEALAAAHRNRIVHRDLKPTNLFLVAGNVAEVKLLDFGIARVTSSDHALTRTGALIGTPGYMSPEQARGERDVGPAADLFALGCVLFKCLTGRAVFVADDAIAVLLKIVIEDAPRLRSIDDAIPEELDDLCARLLDKSPDRRPPDAAAVAAQLAAVRPVSSGSAAPAAPAPPSLTSSERQSMSLMMARVGFDERQPRRASARPAARSMRPPAELGTPPTLVDPAAERLDAVRRAVERQGERLQKLADGSLVVVASSGAATDQAARAARCAMAMRAVEPSMRASLVAGRGVLSGPLPVGEIIDRCVRLVAAAEPGQVRVDDVAAGLLDGRFEVVGDRGALRLRAERDDSDVRTLLGRPTPCVGRERELGILHAFLAECRAEPRARPVLVTAAAGVGKSRLRYEFVRELRQRSADVEIWLGRGDPMRVGSPFGLIANAIRYATGMREGETPATRRHKLATRVARHLPEEQARRTAAFLGETCGTPFPDDDDVQLRSARQDPALMSAQIRRAWEALLSAEARAAPLLLVLEDLQWGDLPSVKLVDAALWVLAEQPFMVLAMARPEVHELFPKLWAERELQEERLGALSRKGGERLVREVLGDRVTPDRARDLVGRSGGNAFYLEELIRSVAEGRGEELPETVLAMASARLERLDPAARRVLRAASVFGQAFWSGSVRALLGTEMVTSDLGDWLSLLDEEEVISARISSRFEGDTEWTFRHALVRQAAYSTLTERDRTVGHRLAAQWLVAAGETDAMVLAEHFERGGASDHAAIWYRRAAEHALDGHDLDAAMARATRGLACLTASSDGSTREDSPELRGALRLVQVRVMRWRGHRGERLETALAALPDLRPGSSLWYRAMSEAIFAVGSSGALDELLGLYQRLGEPAPDADAGAPRTMAFARAAIQLLLFGARSEARAALSQLPPLEDVGDEPMVAALVARARSWWALYHGDFAAHLDILLMAVREFERAGDLHTAAASSANVGYAFMLLGAYAEAEEQLSRTIERSRELGSHTTALHAQHNLGLVRALRGADLDLALRTEQQALAGYRAMGNAFMEGACETYCAKIELCAGRAVEAAQAARRAIDLLSGHPPNRALALAVLAQSLLRRAAREAAASSLRAEALAAAREAMGLLDRASVSGEEAALCHLALAEALHATGDVAAARQASAAAAQHIEQQAARIADPSRRASFLAVPEHARTLQLHRMWTEAGRAEAP